MNPFTGLYASATTLRNSLFDRGILPSRRLQQPVISVGNLSAGGSGKTPFVIALGELLQARGISFDVLSRGYRRKTRGVLLVETGGEPSEFGDEPLLIARRLGVPVIVGESRYAAGQLAEQKFQSQLHLLDDGFQHRSLFRDFDIVLLTERDLHDHLLPSGRLREPLSSLRRAHAIVAPHNYPLPEPVRHAFAIPEKSLWQMDRTIVLLDPPPSPVVFCGIARPQQFFAQVRAAGIFPSAELAFRDHHPYEGRHVERLVAARDQHRAGGFITTEKDAINLGPLREKLHPRAIATLSLTLDRPTDLVDAILSRITSRTPRS